MARSTQPPPPEVKPPPEVRSPPDDPIIGIDLGTTNSLVAHCTATGPRILTSPRGARSLPSVVRLELSPIRGLADSAAGFKGEATDPLYRVAALGQTARDHAVEHPTNTLHSIKRLMGRSPADLGENVEHLPYRVVEGPHQTARVRVADPVDPEGGVVVSPQEVSAMILGELKRWAEADLGRPVRRAVITVPAYFDDAQRQATRDAGRLAGLDVLRIVNEPTAAALAYGLGQRPAPGSSTAATAAPPQPDEAIALTTKLGPHNTPGQIQNLKSEMPGPPLAPQSQRVAIYDLGGGTFDVSILALEHTDQGSVDQVLATDGDTHLGGDDIDQLIIELIQGEIRQPLGRADLAFSPATRQAFRTLAEQTKIRLSHEDEAPIEIDLGDLGPSAGGSGGGAGLGVYQRTLTRSDFEALIAPLLDRTLEACGRAMKNAGLAPGDIDQVVLVGGSTRIPLVRQRVAALFETTPYTALNPDEVVALGASVQGAVLAGIHRDVLLLDVIPLSLGIETMGGAVAKLISANATIPARASETFSTYANGQTKIKIHVLQGERELVKDCRSLATFDLMGVPAMPAGLPKVVVSFLVDANGILSVQAVEERSGRRARIQVVPNHGLARDEIDRIEADSYIHARADMLAHRLIDLRLNARLDIRNIRKQLERLDDDPALEEAYRREIESHIARVEAFIETPDTENDADAFQQAMQAMDHATLRLAELNIARTLRNEQ